MRNVGAYPEHEGIADLDAAIAMWSAPSPTAKATWKAMLRTTLRRHLQQEQTIHETFGLQRGILRILSQHGASFSPDPREQVAREATFACFCGKLFTTGQGLASHKRLQHGVRSLESDLLDGATCPCCLRFFWTTQRLQQHLAYISRRTSINRCYNWLRERGYTMGEEPSAKLVYPTAKKGLRRLDALPAFGPPIELDTIESSRRKAMETELADKLLMLELPDPPQGFMTRLFAAFDATLPCRSG